MKKELKTLRSKKPKEYWKILNKGQKKKQPNISIDVLYEFFKIHIDSAKETFGTITKSNKRKKKKKY